VNTDHDEIGPGGINIAGRAIGAVFNTQTVETRSYTPLTSSS
jgi:hypothetical protein